MVPNPSLSLPKTKPTTRSAVAAYAAYAYLVGLLIVSMALRHMLDFYGSKSSLWFVLGAEGLLLVSAVLACLSLANREADSFATVLMSAGAAAAGISLLAVGLALADLQAASTCCPGPHALIAVFVLYLVGALDFIALTLYVPLSLAILLVRRPSTTGSWPWIRGAASLAVVPALISIGLAPHYYQEIGSGVSGVKALVFMVVALLVAVTLPLILPTTRVRLLLSRLKTPYLAILWTALAVVVAYQALVYPPNDPSLVSEVESRSVRIIAPPSRPDLLRELGGYQRVWDQVQSESHAPNLTFDVMFDGIVPLRPRQYADGEWDVDVKVAQTPQERLATFEQAVRDITASYEASVR